MALQIQIKKKYIAIKAYCVLMTMLIAARYLLKINVPSAAFLLAALIPVFFGSNSELLACVMSYIPLSIAFQYKYALLIAMAVMLLKNRWRMKAWYAFLLVLVMMAWELLHVGYGYFSITEYFRDFAELLFMGALLMIDVGELDYKMIIRSVAVSVVGVCAVMFVMQLQQFHFDILALFSRSAAIWRFGQSNMDEGRFALNFNANNLGFICNLAACSMLLMRKKKEYTVLDFILTMGAFVFAVMTLSRAAIVCMLMIIALYVFGGESKGLKRIIGILSMLIAVAIVAVALYTYVPAIFENLQERFDESDAWNGRSSLLTQYMKFLLMSPDHMLFGIGMQSMFEKVSSVIWVADVPHNSLQEVVVAWGLPGLFVLFIWLGMIIRLSLVYSGKKRDTYQYMPLLLTVVYTMSGQLLTSSRALMALSFSYICLCITKSIGKMK